MTCQVWSYSLIGFAWKHKTSCNSWNTKHFIIACLLLLVNLPAWRGILRNSEQKIILHTIEQLTQYTVLGIQFWSLKNTVVIRICKYFYSYLSDSRRLQCADVNNQLQTVFKRVYTVYTYSDSMINQLLYCWQMI